MLYTIKNINILNYQWLFCLFRCNFFAKRYDNNNIHIFQPTTKPNLRTTVRPSAKTENQPKGWASSYGGWASEILHHQFGMVGGKPFLIVGCLPSINWCRISLAHPQYQLSFLCGLTKIDHMNNPWWQNQWIWGYDSFRETQITDQLQL